MTSDKEQAMRPSIERTSGAVETSSAADVVDGTLAAATGLGILTTVLFPLAIPVIALTAVALIPLLLIPLAVGIVAAPFLLVRRLFRRADAPLKATAAWEPSS
jgi:hypothetical protein